VKKGISPVVATVILVAVALVLAVSLAGWVMGIWGGLGSTEALLIYNTSITKVGTNAYVNVTIYNKGTSPANITTVQFIDDTDTVRTATVGIYVYAGNTTYREILISGAIVTPGKTYVVRFVTSTGNYYEVPIRCVK
jgi:flagellin-like protein